MDAKRHVGHVVSSHGENAPLCLLSSVSVCLSCHNQHSRVLKQRDRAAGSPNRSSRSSRSRSDGGATAMSAARRRRVMVESDDEDDQVRELAHIHSVQSITHSYRFEFDVCDLKFNFDGPNVEVDEPVTSSTAARRSILVTYLRGAATGCCAAVYLVCCRHRAGCITPCTIRVLVAYLANLLQYVLRISPSRD